MLRFFCSLALVSSLFFASCAKAQDASLLPAEVVPAFKGSGRGVMQIVPATGQSFPRAIRATGRSVSKQWFLPRVVAQTAPVAAGDQLKLSFFLRKIEPKDGEAKIAAYFEFGERNTKVGRQNVVATPEWTRHEFSFQAPENADAGKLAFAVGFGAQVVEIGGVSFVNQTASRGAAPTPETKEAAKPNAEAKPKAPAPRAAKNDEPKPSGQAIASDAGWSAATGYLADLRTLLAPASNVGQWVLGDSEDATLARLGRSGGAGEVVKVEGANFQKAHRVEVDAKKAQPWNVQLSGKNLKPIRRGDVVVVAFSARAVNVRNESGEAAGQLLVKGEGARGETEIRSKWTAGAEWQTFYRSFVAGREWPAESLGVSFFLGFQGQTVEIGGVALANLGGAAKTEALPKTKLNLDYAGREPGAAWRKAALERIEQIRKGDFQIRVVDAAGKPVPNAKIELAMKKHHFDWGASANLQILEKTPLHQQILKNGMFNRVVTENDLKWPMWEGKVRGFNRQRTLSGLKWLRDNDLRAKGHVLMWSTLPQHAPSDAVALLNAEPLDKAAVRNRVHTHITQTVTALKGTLDKWDVVNEHYTYPQWTNKLGVEEMATWFKLARAADPNAKLGYNETDVLVSKPLVKLIRDHSHAMMKMLKAQGAPIDFFGNESHFSISTLTPPETMLKTLDEFAVYGLEFHVTEFDIALQSRDDPDQLAAQSDFTRDFLITLFSHSSVKSIITWNGLTPRNWVPTAAFYEADGTLRPHGKVWQDLVTKQWWTNANGSAGNDGNFKTRGFFGDYEVTVSGGGKSAKQTVQLYPGATGATVVLK